MLSVIEMFCFTERERALRRMQSTSIGLLVATKARRDWCRTFEMGEAPHYTTNRKSRKPVYYLFMSGLQVFYKKGNLFSSISS
jgi:hypothetical protein